MRDRERDQTTLPLDFTRAAPAAPAPPPAPAPAVTPPPPPAPRAAPPPPGPPPPASSPAPVAPPPAAAPPQPAPKRAVPPPQPPRALSVGELDRAIRVSLDTAFDMPLWVEGEVSGARPVSSGHLYFCLKDEREDAQIDVAMYKTSITPRARALIKDGARVRLRGRPTFWAPRGRLQFVADRADAVGRGALLEALEKLKAKLEAEGLFAPDKKRALPPEPRTIGVVTSAGGAVIHDICKVAFRRGGARVLLAAASVQGDGAADSIRRALAMLQKVREVDVIVVARGGGSSEDLMAFNDEALVRAVAACRVPVVSAVGHEVDVTLCDFAADRRAATPSQAAEMVVPDAKSRAALLRERRARMIRAMRAKLAEDRAAHAELAGTLGDPRLAIAAFQQTLDDRTTRLEAAARRAVTRRRDDAHRAAARLYALHPRAVLARERAAVARAEDRIVAAGRALLARRAASAGALAARLDALSPLKVLGRGYAIATRADGRAIRAPSDVAPGERVRVRVADGAFEADVVPGAGARGAGKP